MYKQTDKCTISTSLLFLLFFLLYRCCSNRFFLKKKITKIDHMKWKQENYFSLLSLSQCTATCNYHQWLCHRELGLNHEHHRDMFKCRLYPFDYSFTQRRMKKRHVDVCFFLFYFTWNKKRKVYWVHWGRLLGKAELLNRYFWWII